MKKLYTTFGFNRILTLLLLPIIILPIFLFASCQKKTRTMNINLFDTKSQMFQQINLEKYLEGVIAGEINNNAPIEALKAQAVLARTFTLKFLRDDSSKYEGADISTDINEAQAYNEDYINDNIRRAVKETKDIVVYYDNDYINAWFHSNSGGHTTTATDGLGYSLEEPKYIKPIKTNENTNNSKNFKWYYSFTKSEILTTLRDLGISISSLSTFKIGEKDSSGRAKTFIVGGKEISANKFRLSIGSTKLKSTLIDSISVNENTITFSGRGYGHGVGLSQEYAITLANEGKTYKEIIFYFFNDVKIKSYKQ